MIKSFNDIRRIRFCRVIIMLVLSYTSGANRTACFFFLFVFVFFFFFFLFFWGGEPDCRFGSVSQKVSTCKINS